MTNGLREQGERQVVPLVPPPHTSPSHSPTGSSSCAFSKTRVGVELNFWQDDAKRRCSCEKRAGMTPCELWGPAGPQHNVESTVEGCVRAHVCVCVQCVHAESLPGDGHRCCCCNICCIGGARARHRYRGYEDIIFLASLSLSVLLLVAGSLQGCRHGNARHVTESITRPCSWFVFFKYQ